MKVTLRKVQLCFDLHELMCELSTEERREFADAIACTDDVIELVTQQIITGWTEFDSHGSKGQASVHPRGLDKAVRDIAKASGDVAKKAIEQLEDALRDMTESRNHMADKLAAFYRQDSKVNQ